jgi:hypothetical protein
MSTLTFSAELVASVQRMTASKHLDDRAAAFEVGQAKTKPAHTYERRSRQRPRSPDREASRARRRLLGGSSGLPATLRHHYTEGQRAVLCVIAGEIKRHGICDMPIDKIAALAGVGRTTVQTTLHEARRLKHIHVTERPRRGRKSLTNLVRIMSPEWHTWLKRGPSAYSLIGSSFANLVSSTKITDRKKEAAEEEKGRRSSFRPSDGQQRKRRYASR